MFFVLPNDFKDYHVSLLDNENNKDVVTEDDVRKAKDILEKAKTQKMEVEFQSFAMK
jgi:hypothetical protein